MKKILVILGLLLIALIGSAQVQQKINNLLGTPRFVPDADTTSQFNITSNQVPDANGWAKIGDECAGCPSYYYKIQISTKTYVAEDGDPYYYYYFYFFSNSYYTNGSPASTYLQDINFYADDVFIFKIDYLLLNTGISIWGAWMRSEKSLTMMDFEETQMTVQ